MYVTKGIIKSINNKDKMYKKMLQSRCGSDSYETISKRFRHNGKIIDHHQEIANASNLNFININSSIAEQINSDRSHIDYLSK